MMMKLLPIACTETSTIHISDESTVVQREINDGGRDIGIVRNFIRDGRGIS